MPKDTTAKATLPDTGEASAPKVAPPEEAAKKGEVSVYTVRDSIVQLVPGGLYDEKNVRNRDARVAKDEFSDESWFQRLVDSGGIVFAEQMDKAAWEEEKAGK